MLSVFFFFYQLQFKTPVYARNNNNKKMSLTNAHKSETNQNEVLAATMSHQTHPPQLLWYHWENWWLTLGNLSFRAWGKVSPWHLGKTRRVFLIATLGESTPWESTSIFLKLPLVSGGYAGRWLCSCGDAIRYFFVTLKLADFAVQNSLFWYFLSCMHYFEISQTQPNAL